MFSRKKLEVSVVIAAGVLEAIYDECDRFDIDETGGRIIGTYEQKGADYHLHVSGMIGPGPNAARTPTYLMQDGENQERMFRTLEEKYPDIEHLGNWHTHHVNGYPTLSGGDKDTYFATVNHAKQNTDFFYALLVTKKNVRGNPRYETKHFFFRRGDSTVYEIPHKAVQIVNVPMLTAGESEEINGRDQVAVQTRPVHNDAPNIERAKDHEFFSEHYPDLKASISKASGAPYWKGTVELVDGSRALIVAMEDADDGKPSYSITTSDENSVLSSIKTNYKDRHFRSARAAVIHLEKDLNKAIFKNMKGDQHEHRHG